MARLTHAIELVPGFPGWFPRYFVFNGEEEDRYEVKPDGPVWFHWLHERTAFYFQGSAGRFIARRQKQKGDRQGHWHAYRRVGTCHHKRYLGTTDMLTLSHLEEIAYQLREEADCLTVKQI